MSETLSASNTVKPKRRRNRKKKTKTADGSAGNGSSKSGRSASPEDDGSVTSDVLSSQAVDEAERITKTTMMRPSPRVVSNQDILRNSLISKGFSIEEIDQAVMEMWDKELPYDEYDAVFQYLVSMGTGDGGGEMEIKVNGSLDETVKYDGEEETDDSTSNDQATENTVETDDIGAVRSGLQEQDGETDEDESDDDETPPPPALTMAEKLDMVAEFESLTDSIFALTQWVSKAAKADEIEGLCLAEKTQALPTVIRRGIADCKEQAKFDNAILPGLVRLLFSLTKRCGLEYEPHEVEAAEQRTEALLRQARKAALTKPKEESDDARSDIAERVAQFIVSRLAIAVGDAKLARPTSPNTSCHSPTTSSKCRSKEGALTDPVSKRRQLRLAQSRALVEARSTLDEALGSVKSNEVSMLNGSAHQSTNVEVDNVLLSLVDQETKDSFENCIIRLEELQAKANDDQSEKLLLLRAAVKSAEGERLTVHEKIAELKASLEKLTAQDEELACKIGNLAKAIDEEQKNASNLAKQLAEDVQEAKDAVKFGNTVRSLAGMLKTYSKSLESAVTKHKVAAMEDFKLSEDIAVRKMELYLRQVRSCLLSDAQFVGQLLTQIESNSKDLASLTVELDQYSKLGLTTTTARIETSIATKRCSIDDDSKVLESVSKEASATFDDLISRLEQCTATATTTKESSKRQAPHSSLLVEIVAAVKKLAIANWERLEAFLPEESPQDVLEEQTQPAMSTSKKLEQSEASVELPTNIPSTPTTPAGHNIKPKLTWAIGGKPSVTAPKVSLLDIQKQELESRNDS